MALNPEKIIGVLVEVVGDFCPDVYWTIDRSTSETSIKTGLKTEPERQRRPGEHKRRLTHPYLQVCAMDNKVGDCVPVQRACHGL
jgi:hypothetical protein